MGWEPINTAPKDGRKIRLGWLPNWPELEYVVVSHWNRHVWSGYWTPTHWMPLPEAPNATHEGAERPRRKERTWVMHCQ